MLSLQPSALLSKWSGESEKALRAAFSAARLLQPCILFLVGAHTHTTSPPPWAPNLMISAGGGGGVGGQAAWP